MANHSIKSNLYNYSDTLSYLSGILFYDWLTKKSEHNAVVIRNSSSWPNMNTGDPVVSSVCCFFLLFFAAEGLNMLQ